MKTVKVLIGFTVATDGDLEEFALGVHKCMTGNAAFPSPPVTMQALSEATNAFAAACSAQTMGGKITTAAKKNKREALITLLRKLAHYVQQNHGDDLAKLLSSGFGAANASRAQQQLSQPCIPQVRNGLSGQLLAKVKPVPNAKCYEARYAALVPGTDAITFQHGGISTDSRAIALDGLTPGVLYQIQVRAVGGSTGYSGWSDATEHRCM